MEYESPPEKDLTFRTDQVSTIEVAQKEVQASKDVLEKLHPETVTDENDVQRTVYTFANGKGVPVRVMFYSHEETPYAEQAIKGRQAFIFGDKPTWRSEKDWDQFVGKVATTTVGTRNVLNPSVVDKSVYESNTTYLVENKLDKILDVAFSLGVQDEALRDLRQKLVQTNRFDDRSEEMLDQIIAAKMIDDNGSLKTKTDTEGEALLLLALQGDEAAQNILKTKLSKLRDLEQKNKEDNLNEKKRKFEEIGNQDAKPLPLDKLIMVHLTKYSPEYNTAENTWDIQTTFDGTKGIVPRTTIHTSLNHSVTPAGFSYGTWEDTPIAVISPMEKVIDKNGKPAVLNTVDTIFEVSPGRRLQVPEDGSVLIKPGITKDPGSLFEKTSDNEIVYTTDVQPAHIDQLSQTFDKHDNSKLNAELRNAVFGAFSVYDDEEGVHKLTIPEADFERLVNVLGTYTGNANPASYGGKVYDNENAYKDIIETLKTKGISQWVKDIFTEAGIADSIDTSTKNMIVQRVQGELVRRIKKKAIVETIQDLGYTVQPGGMWSWADDTSITERTKALALQMGVRYGAHDHDITKAVEDGIIVKLNELTSGKISLAEYKEYVTKVSLGQQSQVQLRMKYLMGAL